jgi:hypothetical protein
MTEMKSWIPPIVGIISMAAIVIGWGAWLQTEVAKNNAEFDARLIALENRADDNVEIRRRIWDRIQLLEATTIAVDERTKGMAKQIDQMYRVIMESRE